MEECADCHSAGLSCLDCTHCAEDAGAVGDEGGGDALFATGFCSVILGSAPACGSHCSACQVAGTLKTF